MCFLGDGFSIICCERSERHYSLDGTRFENIIRDDLLNTQCIGGQWCSNLSNTRFKRYFSLFSSGRYETMRTQFITHTCYVYYTCGKHVLTGLIFLGKYAG